MSIFGVRNLKLKDKSGFDRIINKKATLQTAEHQYLYNRTTYFGCFSTQYKSPSSKQHFHVEKSSGKSP